MRTSDDLFALFKSIALSDERIRVLTLEGSRVNPSVTPDSWQDYDITFLVTDIESFTQSDEWLAAFGERLFMQKPEAMALFPPDLPKGWFSYLMLFADGVKIDLTLVPLTDSKAYFEQDPLIKVLLDKDGHAPELPMPSDEPFWIHKPSAAFVHDCANEFSFACTYAAKGVLRNELLFANWIFEQILHVELLRMLDYLAGVRSGFPLNTGKHHKWLLRFLSAQEQEELLRAYKLDKEENAWQALYAGMNLFEHALLEVCDALTYACPDYLDKVKKYMETLKSMQ